MFSFLGVLLSIGWANDADRCFGRQVVVQVRVSHSLVLLMFVTKDALQPWPWRAVSLSFLRLLPLPLCPVSLFSVCDLALIFSWLPVLCSLVVGANACFRQDRTGWNHFSSSYSLSPLALSCRWLTSTSSASPNPYALFAASTSSSFSPALSQLVGYYFWTDA